MRVRNFSARFLKARKIGTLKSFTLSCNARIQLKENPYNPKSSVLSPKKQKNLTPQTLIKAQTTAL